jgi:1-acyl-sn-glycerol-3-phosphate acyltransferase
MNPPATVLWLRSLAFWLVFLVLIIFFATLLMLSFPVPFRMRWTLVRSWSRLTLWWLKVTCRLTHEIRGRELIPAGAGIVFAKHQSTWETVALQMIFPPQAWVAKRELLWLPFFGWSLALMKCIALDRGSGRAAVRQLVSKGKRRLEEGLWIVIFPEGTRVPAGQVGQYRIGGAILAEHSGYPVIPVAHNAGEYWPRRSFVKKPGIIQVRIGAPIASKGRSAQDILDEAAGWIESQMAEITTLTRTPE